MNFLQSKHLSCPFLCPIYFIIITSFLVLKTQQACPFSNILNQQDLSPDNSNHNLRLTRNNLEVPKIQSLSVSFSPNSLNESNIHTLSNADFYNGSVIISLPGKYVLSENITFNPNCYECVRKFSPSATAYQTSDVHSKLEANDAFVLGFFAAIVIASNDVTIDLNGFTLQQSKEHALQQRFFSLIEIGSSPFPTGVGPANFGDLTSVQGITIKGGTLGLSSHHGIHGNNAKDIQIKNIVFQDFEVAAVALNGAQRVVIEDCVITNSRKNVPVLGTFSNARFLRPYINYLEHNYPHFALTVQGLNKTAAQIKQDLAQAINNVHHYLIVKGLLSIPSESAEFPLFHNPDRIVDGLAYGFLVGPAGPAVNGFPDINDVGPSPVPQTRSEEVYLRNLVVNNLECSPKEVIALMQSTASSSPQTDPVGAVFQLFNRDAAGNLVTITSDDYSEAKYIGNVLSNAQAIISKAIHSGLLENSGLDTSRNSITENTLQWIEGKKALFENMTSPGLLCNADTMFHMHKGVVAYKLDGIESGQVENCSASKIVNHGEIGSNACSSTNLCYGNGVGRSHPLATYPGYNGANARAFSLASSKNVILMDCVASNMSGNGLVVGFDIHRYSSGITLRNCSAEDISSCASTTLEDYAGNPTPNPSVIGLRVQDPAQDITWEQFISSNLTSCFQAQETMESPSPPNCDDNMIFDAALAGDAGVGAGSGVVGTSVGAESSVENEVLAAYTEEIEVVTSQKIALSSGELAMVVLFTYLGGILSLAAFGVFWWKVVYLPRHSNVKVNVKPRSAAGHLIKMKTPRVAPVV